MNYRRAVLNAFLKVTGEGAFANLAAKSELSAVQPTDVGRSTALLYTAIDHLNYCDYMLAHYIKGRTHSSIKGILRIAAAEIFFMETPHHAVCSESVKLTAEIGKPQLKGFVNGVLRSLIRDAEAGKLPVLPEDTAQRLNIETGYPLFIINEHIDRFGSERCEAMLKANVAETTLRVVYPNDTESVMRELEALGVEVKPGLFEDSIEVNGTANVLRSELFKSGAVTVQSPGAMLACRSLGVLPGMRALDACAAPGGKTAYIFDLMQRRGSVSAWELHPHRAALIRSTLTRLNIPAAESADENGVCVSCRDASVPDPALDSRFDAVLCDVPCSGLGGGSKPDARYRRTEDDVVELAQLQYGILNTCSAYVKPGGALVYSTCTISQRENEGVVTRFLEEHPGYKAEDLSSALPEAFDGRGEGGMLTLFPDTDGTEGFFVAKLKRLA